IESRFYGPNSLLYHFNLHDPNVSSDAACSSSSETLHMTVQCLQSFLQHSFIGAQSPGGRSRSFSVDANGYAKGGGLALLLLKQLSDAERDGDPIEANCLDRFFNQSNLDPPLLLDLLKSNLGHTEGAAGILSLIKVAMCMYHRGITTNMQFTSLNPKIDA
ncbi:unnamed protein product, partial [Adineta steineri]